MKKNLFGFMALSLAIMNGQYVNAQNFDVTTELTSEKGYEQITAMPENLSDYYFVITEKRATNYIVTASENDGPRYKYAVDPGTNLDMVWTIEQANNFNNYATGYAIKSMSKNTYIHPSGNEPWNVWLTSYDEVNSDVQLVFNYTADGYWTFKNGPNKGEQYLGAWDPIIKNEKNEVAFDTEDERMAANKSGNDIGQYIIYGITKTNFAAYELPTRISELEAFKADLNTGWQERIDALVNEASSAEGNEAKLAAIEKIQAMETEIASYKERADVFTALISFADELYASSETISSGEDRAAYKQAVDDANTAAESAASLDAMNTAIEDCKKAIADFGPSEGNTFDFNYFTKGLSYSIDGWTKTYTCQNHAHKTSTEKNNGEYAVTQEEGFIENWDPNRYTPGQLYYTMNDLPQGIYTISAYTFDSEKSGKVEFFAGRQSMPIDASTNLFSLSKLEDVIVDATGVLKFGLNVTEANATNWIGISHIQLVKTGVLNNSDLLAALQRKVVAVNGLVSQPMDALAKENLNDAISAAEALGESSSVDEILVAIAAVETAVQNAQASVTEYASFKKDYDKAVAYVSERVVKLDDSYDAEAYNSVIAAIEERYNNGTLGDADEEVMNVYKALSAAAASQEYKAGVDYSYAIVNNSFETGDMTGWELPSGSSSKTGVFSADGTSGIDGNYLFETSWQGKPMTQTVSGLPAGKYKLTLLYTGQKPDTSGFYVKANDNLSQRINTVETGVFQEVSLETTVAENGELAIRVQGSTQEGAYDENTTWYWYKADNFRLTPVVETVTVSVTEAGWATMMLPFAAAVPEGMTVYSCGAVDENNILTLNEVNTIEANVPYIIASEPKDYVFEGANISKGDSYTSGLLTGVYAETPAPVGSYVLQNQTAGVAFYKVEAGAQPSVKANRAYLMSDAAGVNVRAIYFPNGDADGVESVDAADVMVDVYTMSGIRVRSNVKKSEALNGLKGVYILKAVK